MLTRAGSKGAAPIASKVPEPNAAFWITKVLITGASVWWPDYLYGHFGVVDVSVVIGAALVAVLALQFGAPRYNTWIYWPAFAVVSVAGTEAANGLHRELGLPYVSVTLCYLAALAVILVIWRMSESPLSLRRIHAGRQEIFYWAAVLAAFALGSGLAHATTPPAWLGHAGQAGLALFGVITGITALAWWRFHLNPVAAFWLAFVMTRPLGTALATWLAAGRDADGLGMGRWPVSLGLAALVIGLVVYMAATRGSLRTGGREMG
jgi:uncharacterized membrane-anchored protein